MAQIISVIKNLTYLPTTENNNNRFIIFNPSDYINNGCDYYIKNLSIVPVNIENIPISLILKNNTDNSEGYLIQNILLSHDDPLYLKNFYLSQNNTLILEIGPYDNNETENNNTIRIDVILQLIMV